MGTEAVIIDRELAETVVQIVPCTFRLGVDGQLSLGKTSEVTPIPGGARMTCAATLRWAAVGLASPVTFESVAVSAWREVVSTDEGPRVAFRVRLESAIPQVLRPAPEGSVMAMVNRELSSQRVALSWEGGGVPCHEVVARAVRRPVRELPTQPTPVRRAA